MSCVQKHRETEDRQKTKELIDEEIVLKTGNIYLVYGIAYDVKAEAGEHLPGKGTGHAFHSFRQVPEEVLMCNGDELIELETSVQVLRVSLVIDTLFVAVVGKK